METGYQFADNFRAKLRYSDLGYAAVRNAKINYEAYAIAAEYMRDIAINIEAYAAVGAGLLTTSTEGGLNLKSSNHQQSFFNTGLRYHVAPTLSLVVDISSYSSDAQDISVGFSGRF